MKKITLLLLVTALLFAISCKKDEEPAPKTKTELISAKPWKISTFVFGGTDIWPTQDACDRDDLSIFKADGTYIDDEGATKCDPSDPQQSSSTWKFTDGETKIEVDGSSATIKELTASKMVLQISDGGIDATVTYVPN